MASDIVLPLISPTHMVWILYFSIYSSTLAVIVSSEITVVLALDLFALDFVSSDLAMNLKLSNSG